MADNEQTGGTEEQVQGTEQTEETQTSTENENSEQEENTEEQESTNKEDELPEWARNELERVRGEAASRRVALREAQEALSKAKTPEEVEAATKDFSDKIADLERQILVRDVAQSFGLPKELAEVLKGNNEEELKAHAKTLAQFAVQQEEPESLSGGLNPSDEQGTFDPVAASRKARTRRY